MRLRKLLSTVSMEVGNSQGPREAAETFMLAL